MKKQVENYNENVLLVYFKDKSKKFCASTLSVVNITYTVNSIDEDFRFIKFNVVLDVPRESKSHFHFLGNKRDILVPVFPKLLDKIYSCNVR
jgi:hypothetical protein